MLWKRIVGFLIVVLSGEADFLFSEGLALLRHPHLFPSSRRLIFLSLRVFSQFVFLFLEPLPTSKGHAIVCLPVDPSFVVVLGFAL